MKNTYKVIFASAMIIGMLGMSSPAASAASSHFFGYSKPTTITKKVKKGNTISKQQTKQVNKPKIIIKGNDNEVVNTTNNTVINTQQTVNNYTGNGYSYPASGYVVSGGSSITYGSSYYGTVQPPRADVRNAAPSFLNSPIRSATVNREYRYSAYAYDPNGDQLFYELENAPAGMRINTSSGFITWTPTASQGNQNHYVRISVTDDESRPVYQSWEIYVYGFPTPAPIVTPTTPRPAAPVASTPRTARLAISDIFISSTRNVNEPDVNANCNVNVSWVTNVPSSGQVVYGTESQPSANTFAYDFSAPETGSLQTEHSVKLGCLTNETYYFRIVAFSNSERAVSAEQTLFPFRLINGQSVAANGGTASALDALGNFFTHPFVLLLLVGGIVYLIVRQFRNSGGAAVATIEEPIINIPHH